MTHALETPLLPLIRDFRELQSEARPFVLATILGTEGSTYRKAGTPMLITAAGEPRGLLSVAATTYPAVPPRNGCRSWSPQRSASAATTSGIMAGMEEADAGRVHLDTGVRVGYLPQDVAVGGERTVLAETLSGFDEVWQLEAEIEALAAAMARPDVSADVLDRYGERQHRFEALGGYRLEAQAKVILGGLGFAPDEVHRPLGEFSGGAGACWAALARLLLLHPDLLLLDEPTNHLDLESLEWLEGFLAGYDAAWCSCPTTATS